MVSTVEPVDVAMPLAPTTPMPYLQQCYSRPDFTVTDGNDATVGEICARLDGLTLAIELAAARVRALSLGEILDGLHDRFRLLTGPGGARTAARRQQTLRASVDWSRALLTEPEQVLFRRLTVFPGGFDLFGAQAVGGGADVQRFQVLDQLTLLVDKSLVVVAAYCSSARRQRAHRDRHPRYTPGADPHHRRLREGQTMRGARYGRASG
jgi:predicted ATPase